MRQAALDIKLASAACDIAKNAGKAILEVYAHADTIAGKNIAHKADSSPLTEADLRAHHVIAGALQLLTPHIPIVSEEDEASHAHRNAGGEFWIIDPLDGTKEFIARNGQFTVNIALVRQGAPVLGVVYAPVLDELFWSEPDFNSSAQIGASVNMRALSHIQNQTHVIRVSTPQLQLGKPVRVLASRNHMNEQTQECIRALGAHELVQAGSSLKFCRIAQGLADCYPRLGPTCEWDTAAAQAVLEAAGGFVRTLNGERLLYGKSLVLNPSFVASAWPIGLPGMAT
ncbi:MAG: 3'(2'),5'-bisphosphate nucleotidase CysQ [Phycisphaerales bacterium]